MKKILATLLMVILVFTVLPMDSFNITASAETDGYYTYTVTNGEATITDVSTSIHGKITVPSTIKGIPVVSIGDNAFKNCDSLISVIIPNSVTSMGKSVFHHCENLTSVTIPDSVKSIGGATFAWCRKLKSVTIGNSITSIPSAMFDYCISLEEVSGFKNVTTIGIRAFNKCKSLKSITIYNSVTSIDESAFNECISLTDVWYTGTEDDKAKITIKDYKNSYFANAKWHYNACENSHVYSDECDGVCNSCEFKRTIPHNYVITVVPATTEKDGSATEKCAICGSVLNQRTIKKIKSIALTTYTFVYNGEVMTPDVQIKDSNGIMISPNNYTVTYQNGRKNVGKYNVAIKLKGDYSGSKTLTFTIVPPKTTSSEITSEPSKESNVDDEKNTEETITIIEPEKTQSNEASTLQSSGSMTLWYIIIAIGILVICVAVTVIIVVIRKKKR